MPVRAGLGCPNEVEEVILSGMGRFREMYWNGREWPTWREFADTIKRAK